MADEFMTFAAASRYISERWGARIDPRTVKKMALSGTLSWDGDGRRMLIVRESIDARFDRHGHSGAAQQIVD